MFETLMFSKVVAVWRRQFDFCLVSLRMDLFISRLAGTSLVDLRNRFHAAF